MDSDGLRRVAQAGKEIDPGWYRVHRRLSIHLTRAALGAGLTANHASIAMLVLGIAGAALLVPAVPASNAVGFLVLYLAFLLDKVDGELARLTGTSSARGIFLDRMHHRLVEPALFIAVAAHEYALGAGVGVLVAGFATVVLANAIDENQHLAPYILYKRVREGGRLPEGVAFPRPAAWARAAALLRPLKGFRMLIVALPLFALAYAVQAVTGRAAPALLLVASAIGLAAYLAFQCLDYLFGRLDAEAQAVARVFRDGAAETPPVDRRVTLRLVPLALVLAGVAATVTPAFAAGTFHVDGDSPSCSDQGPGTQQTPYCTIAAAVAAHNGPGTTIRVWPARYFEAVDVPASGAAGSPFVLEGMGSPGQPVLLDGAVELTGPAHWTPFVNTTWRAGAVTWSVLQVLADGVRLLPFAGAADSLPAGSFLSVPGTGLYVNLGGPAPEKKNVIVSRWTHGVHVDGLSWVTVRGLSIRGYNSRGIFVAGGGDHVIENNVVERVGRYGINVEAAARVRVAENRVLDNGNHGIALTTGTTVSTVEGNESARNARPEARAANGIYLFNAPANVLKRNRLHHNQDSGVHVQAGSNQTVSLRNVSWANGDHGFDHLGTTGNVQVNDVAYDNHADGFSFEGGTSNQVVANCIAAANGRTTGRYQVYVDSSSAAGFVSDDNVIWSAGPGGPVKFVVTYGSVAAYSAATGQDTRTIEADPRFYNGGAGDFRLLAGSPAIDAAHAGAPWFEASDIDGAAPADDPATANTGLGPLAYADRGAHEFGAPGLVDVPESVGGTLVEGVSPNPLAAEGVLVFATSRPGPLVVELIDVRGRRVREVLAEPLAAAGPRAVRLDGRGDDGTRLDAGVYLYRVRSADGVRSGKFVVVH